MTQEKEFDFNSHIASLNALLDLEKTGGTVNGLVMVGSLAEIEEHRDRQAEIADLWAQLQKPLQRLKSRIESLPFLPATEHIVWAQSIRAMQSARLMEVDTNTIGNDAQIIRVALSDINGEVVFDQRIALPEGAHVSEGATYHSGLRDEDLIGVPTLQEAWPRILDAFSGVYILSFAQEWDVKVLKAAAEEHKMPVPVFIGEDLQRRCTAYYSKEYYLDLASVAKRMGHPLNDYDALERLKAQAAIIAGMAQGITDVSLPDEAPTAPGQSSDELLVSDEGLGDLEDHPF